MRRQRNIVFKGALVVMSVALASVGVFGWMDAARAFEALRAQSWAILDPVWPLYAAAAIGCLAAQVIAGCATVNFARLSTAPPIWRALAFGFYGAAVLFAAYSADRGAQVILSDAHRSAYEARESERAALRDEIAALSGVIEVERQRLPRDTANVVAERQRAALAAFEAATQVARLRLPEAQRELDARPPLPRDPEQNWLMALSVFAIFLAWAVLEPWGYALAERGREPPPVAETAATAETAPASKPANVHWLRRGLAVLTLGWLSHFATTAPARAAPEAQTPEPVMLAQWQDAKSVAFSMRGRYSVHEIAAHVKRDKSTVYKWFRARDAEQRAA